ncbi:hypothetical protein BRADI_1g17000v3 [Brachypodium distachyon]|uniref:Knottin scorpion toxin-like domain-containing protein n=1 Tax=Brachypodium distachyon TaxID=15368 RepID=A0A0Q3NC65_BRADI|nr:hypothetical protein BRADI_1g17000v3 [Brachypodium distachyon]
MASIQNNTRALFLMTLLMMMISTSLLSSQVSGRNIGIEAKAGTEEFREPYVFLCETKHCDQICKEDKYRHGTCHKDSTGAPDLHCYCS